MRTDGVFTTRQVCIKDWPSGKTLTLIPFGDIHRDSPAFCEGSWRRFKDRVRGLKDVLFLGMGDYLDSYSTTERMIMYNPALHESTKKREEEMARGRVSALAKELEFMKGRLVGLLGGNHFVQFADGTTGDMLLANRLGTNYLGVCSAIRLTFSRPSAGCKASVDIFAHHGKGGGVTAGGKFNAVEKLLNVCDCDIALMGDNHARGVFPAGDRLYLTSNGKGLHVKSKTRWIGRTGSFLRAYVDGEAGYVVDRALPPANLGWIEFDLTPERNREGGADDETVRISARQ